MVRDFIAQHLYVEFVVRRKGTVINVSNISDCTSVVVVHYDARCR